MANHFPDLQNIVELIGPLPAIAGISSTPAVVQPRAVAKEVIGFDLDLDRIDRSTAIDVLTRAIPVRIDPATRKAVLAPVPIGEPLTRRRGAIPLVGKMAVAAVALRTLAEHAEHLGDLSELHPNEGEACGPDALLAVIRECIREMVEHFEAGYPSPYAIEPALRTLSGFTTETSGFPAFPHALGGALGALQSRFRIDPAQACNLDGETNVTSFNTLVALTTIFANAWLDARHDNGSFFAISIQDVHHHFTAIVLTLERLRTLVTPDEWVTAEVPAEPPITAAEMWNLMYRYCRTGALEMLRHGRDGKQAVLDKMSVFEQLVRAMTQHDDPGLRAFRDDEVQDLVSELLHHVQKVQEVLA